MKMEKLAEKKIWWNKTKEDDDNPRLDCHLWFFNPFAIFDLSNSSDDCNVWFVRFTFPWSEEKKKVSIGEQRICSKTVQSEWKFDQPNNKQTSKWITFHNTPQANKRNQFENQLNETKKKKSHNVDLNRCEPTDLAQTVNWSRSNVSREWSSFNREQFNVSFHIDNDDDDDFGDGIDEVII